MGRGESSAKKTIPPDQWEARLAAVRVSKEDMNRLVMNFLVTEGYVEAARLFEAESGTPPGVELSAITDRMHIRSALTAGNVDEAIERVNDLNPEILEQQAPLLFHLQQQRLIELIRARRLEEALAYAAEYLAPAAAEGGAQHPEFLEELERTVALLAFEEPRASPLGELMDVGQRQKTAGELNAAILASQACDREPRLPQLLKLLLWAQRLLDEKAVYPKITDLAAVAAVGSSAAGGSGGAGAK